MTDELRNLSLAGLEMLEVDADPGDEWIFEKDAIAGLGQGDRVISSRRQSFALYEADHIADEVEPMIEDIRQLKLELASLKAQGIYATNGGAAGLVTKGLFATTLGFGALVGTLMLGFN